MDLSDGSDGLTKYIYLDTVLYLSTFFSNL